MAEERSRVCGVVRGAVLTVAGLADVVHSQASRGATQGSDAAPGDLQARGSRLLRRWIMPPDHHLEVMARRVERAARASGDA